MNLIFTLRTKKTLSFVFWFAFLLTVYLYNKDPKGIRLDFEIALHEVGDFPKSGEFYFDTGNGFKAGQFVKFDYHTPANGTFSRYSLILPTNSIERLRFDPLPAAGKLTIKNVIITKYSPVILDFSIKEQDVIPLHSIGKIETRGQALTITADGNDPYLVISREIISFSVFDIGNLTQNIWFDIGLMGFDKFLTGITALILLSVLITNFICSDQPNT